MPIDPKAVEMIRGTRIQLEEAGYPPGMVRNALNRAERAADATASRLSEGIRGQAYLDLLSFELSQCSTWCHSIQETVEQRIIPVLGRGESTGKEVQQHA